MSPVRRFLAPTLIPFLLGMALLPLTISAQSATSPPEGAPYTLAGIDVFGTGKTPDSVILGILGIQQGAEINPAVVTALDEKLRKSGKFAYSRVSSAGFGDRKSYLTVDVVELGEERRFKFNPAPTGEVAVPQNVLDWVHRYEKASVQLFQTLPRRLKDINAGHFLDSDPGLREYEEKMLEMVPENYDVLVKALREDKDTGKRAACATLLGWASDKRAVIIPLEEAMKDPEVQVRTNAARSLLPIAYLSANTKVLFPMEPVLEMIHYPTSADRNKAAAILLQLAIDPVNHAVIREKAGDVLVQMAGAKQPAQREHSITLLTIITGEKHGKDVAKWKAWWKAQKAGTWAPPKKPEPATGSSPGSKS